MNLLYIENKPLLTKIVTYLDYGKINYTTNINDKFDTLIVSQNSKNTSKLMERAKKVIYIAYLDELKICKNNYNYVSKMNTFFNKCNFIIVSMPYLKKIINHKKIIIIPIENLCIGLCKNKLFNLGRKDVTIIDSNYRFLINSVSIVNDYPKINFNLIGYNSNLSKKDALLLNDLPNNLKLYKYCNERILQNYINNSFLIIFFDNIIESRDYLNICLNLKKNMLILNSDFCYQYLIDNKNSYLFSLENISKKVKKILSNRVCNLGGEGFNLIKDNNFINIADKFCKLLK